MSTLINEFYASLNAIAENQVLEEESYECKLSSIGSDFLASLHQLTNSITQEQSQQLKTLMASAVLTPVIKFESLGHYSHD